MRFSLSTSNLINALSVVTHALSPRSTMPILECVLMESCTEGIRLTCSDGSFTIVTTAGAQIEEEGRVIVPGRLFCDVVRKLPSAELTGEVNANSVLTLRCLGSRTTIAGKPAELFPALPKVDALQHVSLPQPLIRDMIQQTAFAVSVDEARKILTGGLMEISHGEVRMVALDGFRLAVRLARLSDEAPEILAVVPGKLLSELSKIMSDNDDDQATLMFSSSQLLVDTGVTQIYASLLEGEFIKYRQIIPGTWKTRVTVDRQQLSMCIDRASLMAKESKTNLIKMHVDGEAVIVTSNSEMGDVYEELDAEVEGEELDIAFNVKYLSDMLRVLSDDKIVMRFNSGVSPCVVCPVKGDDYLYMVLPVRVNA